MDYQDRVDYYYSDQFYSTLGDMLNVLVIDFNNLNKVPPSTNDHLFVVAQGNVNRSIMAFIQLIVERYSTVSPSTHKINMSDKSLVEIVQPILYTHVVLLSQLVDVCGNSVINYKTQSRMLCSMVMDFLTELAYKL